MKVMTSFHRFYCLRRVFAMTKDVRIIGGAFTYHKRLPVEILEVMDFSNTKTADTWYEMITAGINKRINYDMEFNQDGYSAQIALNEAMSKSRDNKKLTFFTTGDDSDDLKRKGVDINSIADSNGYFEYAISEIRNAYEKVDMDDDIETAIQDVRMMIPVLMYTEGINLKIVLDSALKQIPTAINKLKYIIENYELLGERIKSLLEAGVVEAL